MIWFDLSSFINLKSKHNEPNLSTLSSNQQKNLQDNLCSWHYLLPYLNRYSMDRRRLRSRMQIVSQKPMFIEVQRSSSLHLGWRSVLLQHPQLEELGRAPLLQPQWLLLIWWLCWKLRLLLGANTINFRNCAVCSLSILLSGFDLSLQDTSQRDGLVFWSELSHESAEYELHLVAKYQRGQKWPKSTKWRW